MQPLESMTLAYRIQFSLSTEGYYSQILLCSIGLPADLLERLPGQLHNLRRKIRRLLVRALTSSELMRSIPGDMVNSFHLQVEMDKTLIFQDTESVILL